MKHRVQSQPENNTEITGTFASRAMLLALQVAAAPWAIEAAVCVT